MRQFIPEKIAQGDGNGFVLDVSRDDRGRLVAEIWRKASGKTLAIEEVDSIAQAEHWARKIIELAAAK